MDREVVPTIHLPRFDDMHVHLRLKPILGHVLPFTAAYARRAIVMPNTEQAILTADDASWYRGEIHRALDQLNPRPVFTPLMTIAIRDNTTPQMLEAASKAGVVAGKVYPLGVTTNSEKGLHDFFKMGMLETFRAMQDLGMRLLLHGEIDEPRTLVTEREGAFLSTLSELAHQFPRLKIVLEHVTTAEAVDRVNELGDNVAATITAHHLCLTLNDVIGDGLRPHNACMPMPKHFDDRDALIVAATSHNPKFFLGSDSAPHLREMKECARGACGVFSAPVLPAVLAEVFEASGNENWPNRLLKFTSRFGADFYGLAPNQQLLTLEKKDWVVPAEYAGIVPFKAGQTLHWKLKE